MTIAKPATRCAHCGFTAAEFDFLTITKQTVADEIATYLHDETTLAQLVDWSERALMDGEFFERDAKVVSAVVARLGVADVRAFGLAGEDCEELLRSSCHPPQRSCCRTR